MQHKEDQEAAAEYMRLALPLMKQYEVTMTPQNYALWYEYVSGNNDELKEVIDLHIEANDSVSEQQNQQWYQQFFDPEQDQVALVEMRQDLKRVLSEVISFVATGVSSSKLSASKLTDIVDTFHPDMSQDEVQQVVEQVLAETRLAVSTNQLLSEKLNTTMTEIQELKKDLNEAKRAAKVDNLTQLANRRALDDLLAKATRDADNSHIELSIVFADIDFFKKINDTHGHLVGDQVLKVIAETLRDAVKGRDLVARYGGEEFAIVLLNTTITNAINLAENIRGGVAAKRIQRNDTREALGEITMSFGVARYLPSEGIDSFLQRADRALYTAKRKGRNRVVEALPPTI